MRVEWLCATFLLIIKCRCKEEIEPPSVKPPPPPNKVEGISYEVDDDPSYEEAPTYDEDLIYEQYGGPPAPGIPPHPSVPPPNIPAPKPHFPQAPFDGSPISRTPPSPAEPYLNLPEFGTPYTDPPPIGEEAPSYMNPYRGPYLNQPPYASPYIQAPFQFDPNNPFPPPVPPPGQQFVPPPPPPPPPFHPPPPYQFPDMPREGPLFYEEPANTGGNQESVSGFGDVTSVRVDEASEPTSVSNVTSEPAEVQQQEPAVTEDEEPKVNASVYYPWMEDKVPFREPEDLEMTMVYDDPGSVAFQTTPRPRTHNRPCRCACVDRVPYCESVPRKWCHKECLRRCLDMVPTMDLNGHCKDEYNCTCIIEMDIFRPVCAINITSREQKSFTNLQNYFCTNACSDYVLRFENYGKCPDLTGNAFNNAFNDTTQRAKLT